MRLVDEIIESASDGGRPLADVLRKCLILAFELKNRKLKLWAEKELNGYLGEGDLPEYRHAHLHSVGNFSGPMGGWIPSRPLPLAVLEQRHRDYLARSSRFNAPIAVYENRGKKSADNAIIPWPPDLIVMYQTKFIEGYALSQAWQEVPDAFMQGIVETVRNRVLRFALEIRDQLGEAHGKPEELPPQKVEAAVTNYIYGGVNVIASSASGFTQIGQINVARGDFDGLANALRKIDTTDREIEDLQGAIEADKQTFGERTKAWLGKIGAKVGETGLKVAGDLVQEVAKAWLMQYFGLK